VRILLGESGPKHAARDFRVISHSPLVAALQPRAAPGGRTPRHAAPPEESIARGGRGGGGGEAPPCRGLRRTCLPQGRCHRDRHCRRCRAFASRRCSQHHCCGRSWTLILPTSCHCAAAAVAAAAAAAAAVGHRRLCWHPPSLSLLLSWR
jgi:hypothetical protein